MVTPMTEKPNHKTLLDRIAILESRLSHSDRTRRRHQRIENLLNAIKKAQSLYIAETDSRQIYQLLLQSLVEITESEYGFLDEVCHDGDGTLSKKNLAISDISWDAQSRSLYRQLQERDMKFSYLDNLAGLPALTGETIIANDPTHDIRSRGLPKGHPQIRSFLGMPIFFGGKLICVAGVANKPGGYDEKTAQFLEPLLSTCGSITYALQKESVEKENQKMLAESEKRYRMIADFTYDWEYWMAPAGHFVYVSPSCRRITGYRPEEFMNDPGLMDEIVHPDDQAMVRKSEQKACESCRSHTIEFRIQTRTGDQRWVAHACRPVYDGKKYLGRRGSNRDITVQKRLQDESIHAHKMHAITTLAGGMAHQFNNALSVITGSLELMVEDDTTAGILANYADEMKSAAEQMKELTDQLLAYARGGKYQAVRLSLTDLIAKAIPLIRFDHHPDIAMETDLPDDSLMVMADQAQIHMMLSAVLTNAVEAIKGKGHIRISLEKAGRVNGTASKMEAASPAELARLRIVDDGHGMRDATRERIFEPFFTTKFEGRGLGMAAVSGIVENHNGVIRVASEWGKGTTVHIDLPLVKESSPPTKKPTSTPPAKWAESKTTILVIDDDQSVLRVCRTMLLRLGLRVLQAQSAAEAIEIVKEHKGAIDLALLDVLMPDITGDELYPLLKAHRPDMKVIVNSGYSLNGPAQRMMAAGAEAFIRKPFTKADLLSKISEIYT